MAVWIEDGHAGGRRRIARGWAGTSARNPLLLAGQNAGDRRGGALGGASGLAGSALLALLLSCMAVGALAAQSSILAALTLGGLAGLNFLSERRWQRALRMACLAGCAVLFAFAALGWAWCALILLAWRVMGETHGLHWGFQRLGPADGPLAGLGLWPVMAAGLAGSLLIGHPAFLGVPLATIPALAVLAWPVLLGGIGCAALWLAARIASFRLREPFSRRDAVFALVGSVVPLALALAPDLAIGVCAAAAMRLSLSLPRVALGR